MEALTFRAEPEFVMALKDYADKLGISVNAAIKEIVVPGSWMEAFRLLGECTNDRHKTGELRVSSQKHGEQRIQF